MARSPLGFRARRSRTGQCADARPFRAQLKEILKSAQKFLGKLRQKALKLNAKLHGNEDDGLTTTAAFPIIQIGPAILNDDHVKGGGSQIRMSERMQFINYLLTCILKFSLQFMYSCTIFAATTLIKQIYPHLAV